MPPRRRRSARREEEEAEEEEKKKEEVKLKFKKAITTFFVLFIRWFTQRKQYPGVG
jgi:hypothetical protein